MSRIHFIVAMLACLACSDGPLTLTHKEASLDEAAPMADDLSGGAPSALAPAAEMAKKAAPQKSRRRGPGDADAESDVESAAEAGSMQPRMVHYSGYLKFRAANIAQALQQAAEVAVDVGGYVESLTDRAAVLRVPWARFRPSFARLATLHGAVLLERSMSAQDVTDAFVAVGLRLKTLTASRERLIDLLARARRAKDKLQLLQEIRRLTEQIDMLAADKAVLASLAAFSRISVEVEPYQLQTLGGADEPIAAFRWIHRLSPFHQQVADAGDDLELPVPEGFVLLDREQGFVTESADGARLWASSRANNPQGDSAFWLAALRGRLESKFAEAATEEVGDFHVLRLQDPSPKAYRYVVAVRVVDDEVQLVEVYYPSPAHEERHRTAVRAVIAARGGGV